MAKRELNNVTLNVKWKESSTATASDLTSGADAEGYINENLTSTIGKLVHVVKNTSGGGGSIEDSIMYGVCDSSASTKAKTVTVTNWPVASGGTIPTGLTITVKFSNSNSASSPTLNVNSSGAIAIKKYGSTSIGTSTDTAWSSGAIVTLTYDGTYWIANDHIDNSWVTSSDVKVDQDLTSNNTNHPILMSYASTSNVTTTHNNYTYRNNSIYGNPSTGTVTAKKFVMNGKNVQTELIVEDVTIDFYNYDFHRSYGFNNNGIYYTDPIINSNFTKILAVTVCSFEVMENKYMIVPRISVNSDNAFCFYMYYPGQTGATINISPGSSNQTKMKVRLIGI